MGLALKAVFTDWYNTIFVKDKKNGKYAKFIMAGLVVFAIGWGAYYAYNYFIFRRESAAQKIFNECLREFENVEKGDGSWYDVQVAFQMGYKQHASSKLAPYFLAYKAEALNNDGKKKEAIETLGQALEKMNKSAGMFSMYKTKLALMKLDMKDDPVLQKEGLQELEAIACVGTADKACEESSGNHSALYYLGLYHWEKNDIQMAKNIWQKLVAMQVDKEGMASGYIASAREKLSQID